MNKFLITALMATLLLPLSSFAGSLDDPGTVGSNMPTTTQIYELLNAGTAITVPSSGTFNEPASGPTAGARKTLAEIALKLPVPDNSNGAAATQVAAGKTFWGLRNDGTWGMQTGANHVASYVCTTGWSGTYCNIRNIYAIGFSIADKAADGNNSASIANWGVLQGISGDYAINVSIIQTGVIASFDDVTGAAGINKPVSVTPLSLQGAGASNYNLIQPSGLTASINASQATFDWNGFSATVAYNGSAHPVTVFVSNGGALNTVPTIVYKDASGNVMGSAPINAGTYIIKATSNDLTWTGSESKTLVITL